MRFSLPLTLLLATLAPAAPVPVDKVAEQKQLEALWSELTAADSITRTRAVLALVDHPRAVEFLAEKLPPVKATADQLEGWLTDLNSHDEKVWKAAQKNLRYYDPRIGLSLDRVIELVFSDNGRRRLMDLWWHPSFCELITQNAHSLQFGVRGTGSETTIYELRMTRDGGKADKWPLTLDSLDSHVTKEWKQVELGAVVLSLIDTKASRLTLDLLASGHKQARPTRAAVELLKAKRPVELAKTEFARVWEELLDDNPPTATQWVAALARQPEAVKDLRPKLPAIKAGKDQVSKWLAALASDDGDEWKPAFEQMLYFHPLLGMPLDDQLKMVTSDRGRAALLGVLQEPTRTPPRIDVPFQSTLSFIGGDESYSILALKYREAGEEKDRFAGCRSLNSLQPPHWQRARLAIIALERMKTDDAKAVLKQLADGHPDILPTKEAKAALERMNGK